MRILPAALLACSLTGCVAVPLYQPYRPTPLVAIPGPAKTEAEFHRDDTDCRTQAAAAVAMAPPATPQAVPAVAVQTDPGTDPAKLPGVTYLRCMAARNNTVEPQPQALPPLYAYYQPVPIYVGYGYGHDYYPWLYGGIGGFYGGYRFAGGYRGYEGFRGGYGGFHHGYEGFHGGYGGFHGGGAFHGR